MKTVLIVMGSENDLPKVEPAIKVLAGLGVSYRATPLRKPDKGGVSGFCRPSRHNYLRPLSQCFPVRGNKLCLIA